MTSLRISSNVYYTILNLAFLDKANHKDYLHQSRVTITPEYLHTLTLDCFRSQWSENALLL